MGDISLKVIPSNVVLATPMNSKPKVIVSTCPWHTFFGESLFYIPTGISYLAGILDREGYPVTIINPDSLSPDGYISLKTHFESTYLDKNMNDSGFPVWRELEIFLRNNPFDILGISVMISQFPSAHFFARLAKKVNPRAIVVFGGIGVTVKPELAFEGEGLVDYVVRGEGEFTFLELIKRIEEGKPLDTLNGISYKENGNVRHNPDVNLVSSIDSIPHPAKHCYRTLRDGQLIPPIAYGRLFFSRGCPFQCTYCDSNKLWTHRVRYSSPGYVVEQIRQLKERYGTRLFVFDDDNFFLNPKVCNAVLDQLIQSKLNISWRCEMRANQVKDELLKKMKRAGCQSITIGIESGNPEILLKIKKGVTTEEMIHAAKLIKRQGIALNAFFMFGFPWETESQMRDTLNLMYTIAPDGEVGAVHSFLIPYPGTAIYEEISSLGKLPDIPLHQLHHRNQSVQLTPHMEADLYRAFTLEVEKSFNDYNLRTRVKLLYRHPRYFLLNLQQRGMLNVSSLLKLAKTVIAGS
jgi:anaerobic magnesium-protoporphyrin IX monomethyl ester cyclase